MWLQGYAVVRWHITIPPFRLFRFLNSLIAILLAPLPLARSGRLLVQQRRPVQQQADRAGFGAGSGHRQEALAVRSHVEQRRWRVRQIYLEQWPQGLDLQRL